ncbi:MAG TPA: DUF2313 domain-containing protein [Candidatus Aphodousia faecavium]|nr:DUF2313 domain-containing protein [Candidatus Aphodousia faecavium]
MLKRDFDDLLTKLLPPGPAWHRLKGSPGDSVLTAGASQLQRVDTYTDALVDEADPRTASQTFSDWLRVYGIPDDCLRYLENVTEQQYRQYLLVKVRRSGLTADFFKELGAIFGIDVDIGYCRPFRVTSRVDKRLYDPEWGNAFLFVVTADLANQKDLFRVTYHANSRLATWGIEFFECLIKSNAPAHAQVIFRYE